MFFRNLKKLVVLKKKVETTKWEMPFCAFAWLANKYNRKQVFLPIIEKKLSKTWQVYIIWVLKLWPAKVQKCDSYLRKHPKQNFFFRGSLKSNMVELCFFPLFVFSPRLHSWILQWEFAFCGLHWYFEVYFGILRFTLVFCGLYWYF